MLIKRHSWARHYKNADYLAFSSYSSEWIVSLSVKDHALLMKLFYKNGNCALAALRKFRSLKGTKKGCVPILAVALKNMIQKFEEKDSFEVKSRRRQKSIISSSIEYVATVLKEEINCAWVNVRSLDMLLSTLDKIIRNMLYDYPYKITHVRENLPVDLPRR